MKTFNKTIKVEVSVDSIAKKLLASFEGSDFKHAEILTEAIIGSALAKDSLSYVYNALNGYTAEIDFKVGEVVEIEGLKKDWNSSELAGPVTIEEIDLYKESKLKVKWINSKGNESSDWVSHTRAKLYVETKTEEETATVDATDFSQAH